MTTISQFHLFDNQDIVLLGTTVASRLPVLNHQYDNGTEMGEQLGHARRRLITPMLGWTDPVAPNLVLKHQVSEKVGKV